MGTAIKLYPLCQRWASKGFKLNSITLREQQCMFVEVRQVRPSIGEGVL